MSSFFDASDEPTRPSEGQPETTTLAFEAEFDGLRRQPVPTEETLLDPSRYWDLAGGGTD